MNALKRRKLEGAPRWMVTFADLMALLFAMFVLLLSFSEVDSDSFKRNAGPMRDAFGKGDKMLRTTSLDLPKVGEAGPSQPQRRATDPTGKIMEFERRVKAKKAFMWQFKRSMARELARSLIVLIDEGDRIVIRFPDQTAFAAGSAELSKEIEPVLLRIASVVKATQGQIFISGHTDDSPISTSRFRSNWDLSTGRAVSVVHFLIDRAGIPLERIVAQGFAHSRPLVKNDTHENQSRNRRVEISIEITAWDG